MLLLSINIDKLKIIINFSFKYLNIYSSSIKNNYKFFINYKIKLLIFRYIEILS